MSYRIKSFKAMTGSLLKLSPFSVFKMVIHVIVATLLTSSYLHHLPSVEFLVLGTKTKYVVVLIA